MNGCGIETRLDAFHDGELNAAERAGIAEHLQGCAVCAAALEQMQRMSVLLASDRRDVSGELILSEVGTDEIGRIHAAVDREMNGSAFLIDRSFWRTAAVLSGLAASVLIVASAWLMETPLPRAGVALHPAGPLQAWERVAMGRSDPLPYAGPAANPDQSALADAHVNMTNWMLDHLKGPAAR